MSPRRAKLAIDELRRRIGSNSVRTAPEILACYAFDATNMRSRPLAVVFPGSTGEVRDVMAVCLGSGVAVVPRGAGTGFAGGTVPANGSIVVSTERLNRIIHIDASERVAIVQAGVVNGAFQREVAKYGLMFPPDPSSLEVSTLGGNVAQDAGGPRALKYGVTRDYVLGVEAVTWEAKVTEPAQPVISSKRWDPVTSLLVGGEGTLGFITKIWVRLLARPKSYSTVLAFFTTTVAAAAAVSRVLDCAVVPAAVEMIDAETMECIRGYVDVGIPDQAGCSLLIEADGREGEAGEVMDVVERAVSKAGAIDVRVADSEADRDRLWKMRRSISPSLARIAPCKVNEDVCVPRSKLPVLVEGVGRLSEKYALRVPTFGHAGDGNLHVNVMLDRSERDQMRRAKALVEELFEVTLRLEGTISGEHGIGVTKLEYLPRQLGPVGWEFQTSIKRAFDPKSFINPGKVISQN
jgi:glycolate oxidase